MAVKIVTAEGLEYIFNPSFRVTGLPLNKDIPSISIGGRDGEVVHEDAIKLTSRNITVTGHIYGATPTDADEALDQMLEVLAKGELRLYKDESESKFIRVRLASNSHNYISGTNRVVASCNLSFIAHDPYFYEPLVKAEQSITESGTSWSLYRGGTVEWQQPVIQIKAREGSLVKPSINNMTAGTKQLSWPGALTEGMSLVINCERRLAYITDGALDYYLAKWGLASYDGAGPTQEEQVTTNMDTNWLIHGWPLKAGNNTLIYSGDEEFSHNAEVIICWMPRYY